jgi:hypothetical protein
LFKILVASAAFPPFPWICPPSRAELVGLVPDGGLVRDVVVLEPVDVPALDDVPIADEDVDPVLVDDDAEVMVSVIVGLDGLYGGKVARDCDERKSDSGEPDREPDCGEPDREPDCGEPEKGLDVEPEKDAGDESESGGTDEPGTPLGEEDKE